MNHFKTFRFFAFLFFVLGTHISCQHMPDRLSPEDKARLQLTLQQAFDKKDTSAIDTTLRFIIQKTNKPHLVISDSIWMWMVKSKQMDYIKLLLQNGFDPNHHTSDTNALSHAIITQDTSLVSFLLQAGSQLNDTILKGSTPLITAIKLGYGKQSIAQKLIASGASVEQSDNKGSTPLMYASSMGLLSTVKELLSRGASPKPVNNLQQSALLLAIKATSYDKNRVNQKAMYDSLTQAKVKQQELYQIMRTRIVNAFLAARKERLQIVEMLLAKGASIRSKNGESVLAYAVGRGYADFVEVITKKVSSLNEHPDIFVQAALGNNKDVFKRLINIPFDSSSINFRERSSGKTPLILAASKGNLEICSLLVKHGADVNATDTWGSTALQESAYWGHLAVVAFLLKQGANVNDGGDGGLTALIRAASRGHKLVCEALIKSGADVNLKSKNGQSPLNVAKAKGHKEIVALLRRHKAR